MGVRSNLQVGSSSWIMRRAQWRALGIAEEDLDKPKIAVVNSSSELAICFSHLDGIVPVVKAAIREAGGLAFEVRTVAPSDNVTSAGRSGQYVLPSRDLVANDIEAVVEGALLDGMVCLASCDKTAPGQMMAAARTDVPSVVVACGYQPAGSHEGQRFDVADLFAAAGRHAAGELTLEEVTALTEAAISGPGVCTGMATANSMHLVAEALGFAPPGTTPVGAGTARMWEAVRRAGALVVAAVLADRRPRRILSPGSFRNAVAAVLAVGGSINTIKHLQAIAYEGGLDVDVWGLFESLAGEVPLLSAVRPGGWHTIESFEAAGGTLGVLKQLEPLLDLEAATIDGRRLGEVLATAGVADDEVIRPLARPVSSRSTIGVLRGSLAPEGAVVKLPVDRAERPRRLRGEARVVSSRAEALAAVADGRLGPGQVLVLRGVGPKGAPGMAFTSAVVFAVEGAGLGGQVAVVTDGQISGLVNRGIVVGEVAPEGAVGGPIGLVRDGDQITIDVDAGRIDLDVPEEEVRRRSGAFRAAPSGTGGLLGAYEALVGPVSQGLALNGRARADRPVDAVRPAATP